ncbi:EAL domain-containing protein [Weissella koreensis]|uniref:EAL domain-containing protein n=1 Tax=Weissella koreensis TaxID=165096 RepID=A0A7H1MNH4_9LACO|nr:EAL domain-containing protein [Weissella koreensis]QGN21027.1 EAL domain-containing protein [Weissella koreensis]QNT63766.1 EAL domain-containing protein [Weissella koreensis]QNT65010.1 EAL domain-containing protein [Weissella koreensis]
MAEFIDKISHRTGMKVVIEGIENELFSNWLSELGVMLQQDFCLERPVEIA